MAGKYVMPRTLPLLIASERRALLRCPLVLKSTTSPATPLRAFTTTRPLMKKRKIAPAANSPPLPSSSSSSAKGGTKPDPENPLDFSSLTSSWAPHDAHFKSQLQIITHGGRFNPDSLGSLPVNIRSASTNDGEISTFPLKELAQVVPRSGRNISLLVNDKDYIKPIISAVQSSKDFNQQPQRSEDNDLELLMKVEVERKEEVVKRVKECTQGWRERIRQTRTKHEKAIKDWKKDGLVLPDVARRVEKELQKVQDQKMVEIDREEAQLIKQLDRGQ